MQSTTATAIFTVFWLCTVDGVDYDTVDRSIRYLSEDAALEALRHVATSKECKDDVDAIWNNINKTNNDAKLFWTNEKRQYLVKGFASGPFVRFG